MSNLITNSTNSICHPNINIGLDSMKTLAIPLFHASPKLGFFTYGAARLVEVYQSFVCPQTGDTNRAISLDALFEDAVFLVTSYFKQNKMLINKKKSTQPLSKYLSKFLPALIRSFALQEKYGLLQKLDNRLFPLKYMSQFSYEQYSMLYNIASIQSAARDRTILSDTLIHRVNRQLEFLNDFKELIKDMKEELFFSFENRYETPFMKKLKESDLSDLLDKPLILNEKPFYHEGKQIFFGFKDETLQSIRIETEDLNNKLQLVIDIFNKFNDNWQSLLNEIAKDAEQSCQIDEKFNEFINSYRSKYKLNLNDLLKRNLEEIKNRCESDKDYANSFFSYIDVLKQVTQSLKKNRNLITQSFEIAKNAESNFIKKMEEINEIKDGMQFKPSSGIHKEQSAYLEELNQLEIEWI